jgi:proline dehydrogenase
MSSGTTLSEEEINEWKRVVDRIDRLCRAARDAQMSVFIDAEESWIQDAIDGVTIEMMAEYNRERAVVFHTVQMYRQGRLGLLEKIDDDAKRRSYRVGIKLVRGAYLEKEQEWAAARGLEPAVYTRKEDTDRDFDDALRFIVDRLGHFSLCAATHNEASTQLLIRLMDEMKLETHDPRIEFSQLYGMGNHLTYNLGHHGYNASKYVPYGPVELVIPYLIRRAQENSSVRGQTGRELSLVKKELKRRRRAG